MQLSQGELVARMSQGEPVMVIEYAYDAAGLRTQKKVTVSGVTSTTDYFLHGKLLIHQRTTTKNPDGTETLDDLHFSYDAQSRPAMVSFKPDGAEEARTYSYLHNLQGDIIGIVDTTGTMVVQYGYDAWGRIIDTRTLTDEYELLAKLNPFRYRGYQYDEETGLYYLRSRYYNPEWGRFINEDILIGTGALLSHNMFAYCENSPVKMVDPDGMNGFTDFMGEVGQAYRNDWNAFCGRSAAVWNNPSPYTIGDMVTFGLVSQTDRAWHPKETFSAEHWRDSFWAALGWVSYGASAYGMAGGTSLLNPGTLNLPNAPTYRYKSSFGDVGVSFNAENLNMTKTVAGHIDRAYVNSPLTIREIMGAARPMVDKQVATALRWEVPGAMLGAKGMIPGIWELVIDLNGNRILHFLFNSKG